MPGKNKAARGHPKGWTPNPARSGRSFLSPLVAGFKVCQVCLARVYRGFRILDPCTTCVRPVYGMGYIVAGLQGYNGGRS
jgi:hypothetical protein